MAMENVKKFVDKLAADEALQAQLKDKKADDVVAAAAGMGFDFTKEELKEFGKGIDALTPEQLTQAAGGNCSDFNEAVDNIRQGILNGAGAVAEGACWVGGKISDGAEWMSDKVCVGYGFLKASARPAL